VAVDTFGFAGEAVKTALGPLQGKLADLIGEIRQEILAPMGLSVWGRAQRSLQPYEAWLTFKDWLDARNPRLAFSVARGLVMGAMIPEVDRQWAGLMRQEARARLTYLLPPGTILAMPTTPFSAPKRGLSLAEQNPLRERILCLCAHGGLTGVPQVSIPGAIVDGAPIGLSIVGGHGTDATLVAVATALARG
jgi:amidase